jgi:putative DNA primase/helicase
VAAADPEQPGRSVLACAKCNLGPVPGALAYRVTSRPPANPSAQEQPDGFVCQVVWEGPAPYTADQLAARPQSAEDREQQQEARGTLRACAEFLRRLLTAGPLEAWQCKRACDEAGFARRTAERAARRLGVEVCHHPTEHGRAYLWRL